MKDLGHAKQILGMKITRLRDKRKIYLSQKKYIERVLERFNMKRSALQWPEKMHLPYHHGTPEEEGLLSQIESYEEC